MSMTGAARGAAFAFLLVGAGVGFAAIYPWMHKRAPELAKPLPMLKPRSNSGEGGASDPAKPPPLDTALLKQLEDKVKSNPKDIASLTELGGIQAEQGIVNHEAMSTNGVPCCPDGIQLFDAGIQDGPE